MPRPAKFQDLPVDEQLRIGNAAISLGNAIVSIPPHVLCPVISHIFPDLWERMRDLITALAE